MADDDDEDEAAHPAAAAPGGEEGDLLVDRLWEEYKLIQSKIDKIGDFQFKVKSWSATLLAAEIFAGKATAEFALMVCALIIALIFHLSERKQRLVSQRLGRRAQTLERAFSDLPPGADPAIFWRVKRRIPNLRAVPGIARAIMGPPEHQTAAGDAGNHRSVWPPHSVGKRVWHWLTITSDDGFYVAQYLALGVFILPKLYGFLRTWLKP